VARRGQTTSRPDTRLRDPKIGNKYRSVPIEKMPPPPPGPAIEFRSAQLALWRRVRRSARVLAFCAGFFVAFGLVLELAPVNGFTGFVLVVCALVGVITGLTALIGLKRTWWFYRTLHRHEWTVFDYSDLRIRENAPVIMLLRGPGKQRYPVKFTRNEGVNELRADPREQVWFAGDPERHGVLTVAGGGEMYRTRPNPPAKRGPARPVKPPKPLTEKQQRRRDAKRRKFEAKQAERRRKQQERQREMAAKAAKNPPKPAKPAKPRKPPRQRGQKIKWQ